jgi:hypothetical protein
VHARLFRSFSEFVAESGYRLQLVMARGVEDSARCADRPAGRSGAGSDRDLIEENRLMSRQLGRRRLRLTDAGRRRLAARASGVGPTDL